MSSSDLTPEFTGEDEIEASPSQEAIEILVSGTNRGRFMVGEPQEPFHGPQRRRLHDRVGRDQQPPREPVPDDVVRLRGDVTTGISPPRIGTKGKVSRQIIEIVDNAGMEAYLQDPSITFRTHQIIDLRPDGHCQFCRNLMGVQRDYQNAHDTWYSLLEAVEDPMDIDDF